MKNRILSSEVSKYVGKKVTMAGWVHSRRDHGKIIFIDLRDRDGLTQIVFIPKTKAYQIGKKLRPEYVLKIEGKVNKRPKGMENPKISSGKVELEALETEILNLAKTPPFEIDKDTKSVDEERRLKYRYLDLRSQRMKKNLILRAKVAKFIRDFLTKEGFIEIETPCLTKGTPEGAREYIVPSRLQAGKFYVLPQSPQQFKQLLMVAGLEKYFQLPRCFRDEDPRGDRQPEFTQLDIEMSFVSQEDILQLTEKLWISLVKEVCPEKKITKIPFPRLSYKEVMKKYKTDKPDLRKNKKNPNELAFCWIIDMPLFEYSRTEKKLVSGHHPFTKPKDEDLKFLEKDPLKVRAYAYDSVLNGVEIGGGSVRIHDRKSQEKIFKILKISDKEAEARFGHMLRAFEYGAPPHGGIAPGLDRLVMILANEASIREVIAFPKTGDARDLMMDAPSELPASQLHQAHIEIKKKGKKAEKYYKKY